MSKSPGYDTSKFVGYKQNPITIKKDERITLRWADFHRYSLADSWDMWSTIAKPVRIGHDD